MDHLTNNLSSLLLIQCITFLLLGPILVKANILFDQNFDITFGSDHIIQVDGVNQMRLFLDNSSGAGFVSKSSFGSGFFHMRMKLHQGYSAGVVTTFYLISNTSIHDELDIEFLGDTESKNIVLQTNVFVNNQGHREQKIHLWFDPTATFHYYAILWNQHQIVFFVDDTPIRVYKNNIGVPFPTQPMNIQASIWDGSSWATDGGKIKIDLSKAPFNAYYEYSIPNGCAYLNGNIQDCYSPRYPWNANKFWTLDSTQQAAYDNVRKNLLIFYYCTAISPPPPECKIM